MRLTIPGIALDSFQTQLGAEALSSTKLNVCLDIMAIMRLGH